MFQQSDSNSSCHHVQQSLCVQEVGLQTPLLGLSAICAKRCNTLVVKVVDLRSEVISLM